MSCQTVSCGLGVSTPSPLRLLEALRLWAPLDSNPEWRALSYFCWCVGFALRLCASLRFCVRLRGPPPRCACSGGAPAPPSLGCSRLSSGAPPPLSFWLAPSATLRAPLRSGTAVSRLRRAPARSPCPAVLRYASHGGAGRAVATLPLARARRSRGVLPLTRGCLPSPRGSTVDARPFVVGLLTPAGAPRCDIPAFAHAAE